MSVSKMTVEVTSSLYEMRSVMREMLGDKYMASLAPFIEMYTASGRAPLEIAAEVSTAAQNDGKDTLGVLALVAAVEMLEPSDD